MKKMSSYKSAKTFSGVVYSYPVKTVKEFLQQLSLEKGIPSPCLILLHEDSGQLDQDFELSDQVVYSIFLQRGVLREWVSVDKLDWTGVAKNPAAIDLLERNPDKIDWSALSSNPAALHLLEQNQDKIDWKYLSGNSVAIHLLEQNPGRINWGDSL